MSLNKILFLLLFFCSFLFAHSSKDLGLKLYISSNNTYILKKDIDLTIKKFKDYKVKLTFDPRKIKNEAFYVKFFMDVDNLVDKNIKLKYEKRSVIFKIDSKTPQEIYFTFKSDKYKKIILSTDVVHVFEYKYFYEYISTLQGISYGVVFCAFFYSFIIYLSTFNMASIYYGFMQLFLLIQFIQVNSALSFNFINTIIGNFIMIFALLFSRSILSFNSYKEVIVKIFNFFILVHIIDIGALILFQNTIYEYISLLSVLVVIILFGLVSIFQGYKLAIFFVAGWLTIFLTVFFVEFHLTQLRETVLFNIGLPLESIVLSIFLGIKLKKIIKEKRENEKLFVQQSKLASMGEMLNNIAHQWRQPLANLSFINMDLQRNIENKKIKEEYLKQIIEDSNEQIDFMSETLENFKGFYQPNRKKEDFLISDAVKNAINIIGSTLESEGIDIRFEVLQDKKVKSYKNEYSQVVLNILSNAKEALLEGLIENPYINIELRVDKKDKSILTICDNGLGIKEEIIEKIFEPYFSTKYEQNSGIGLYMSKVIVSSHLKGEISVSNTSKGACFRLIM